MNEPDQNENLDLRAPARFVDALASLGKERVLVPSTVDESVLAQARPQLARARLHRPQPSMAMRWTALAASLVFGAWLAHFFFAARLPGDLNHDGRVDILDSFQLARELKQQQPLGRGNDVNGDGRVDAEDVEFLARRAVQLEKGGRS